MVFVFKTSVKTKMQAKRLKPHLDKMLTTNNWNFDLEDIDKVLRVESEENIELKIIDLLRHHNHNCEELE
jgi:NurA-like 5'-3' nuclease